MENVAIALALASIACAFISLYYSFKAQEVVVRAMARKDSEPKPKGILVPGRGIFSKPPKKRAPKYCTEEERWRREQDEKRKHKS